MKKYRIFAFLAGVVLALSVLVFPSTAEPSSRPDTSGAVSVLIYNLDSDSLVFSQNSSKQVFPCATVKIMVALTAIEYFESTEEGLDTMITVPAEVIRESQGLNMELRRNETLPARDLIAGMVVAGANDAAYTLALAIDGDMDTFLARMNKKAAEMGMKDTVFYNVSGLDDKPSTTADDLLILGKKAFENSFYMELAATTRYKIAATAQHAERTLYTRNYLLSKQTYADYYYAPATGMNAGATESAGYCIVASARINNQNYLCVVMGAGQFENFKLAKALFQWVSDTHGYRVVLSRMNVMGELSVALGRDSDYITVVPKDEVTCFMPMYLEPEEIVEIKTELFFEKLTAPVKAGLIVGEAVVYLEGKEVSRVDLVTSSSLSRDHTAQLSRRVRNFFVSPTFFWIIGITLPICLAYVLITARLRYLRMVKQIMEVPEEEDENDTLPPAPKLPDKRRKERP